MKKIFICLMLIMTLSLSALYIAESKTVSATQVSEYFNDVVAYLPDNSTWFDGGSESVRYGYFDRINKIFFRYKDVHGEAINTNYFAITPNDNYSIESYNITQYHNNNLIVSYRGKVLLSDDWIDDLYPSVDDTIYINYELDYEIISLTISYRTGYDYEINDFIYNTTTYDNFRRGTRLIDNGITVPIPPSVEGQYFTYWQYEYFDGITQSVTLYDINTYQFIYTGTLTALYSPSVVTVTFYNGLTVLTAQQYATGVGTIEPPNFSFNLGQRLVGWSNRLGGERIDLAKYRLTTDINLYAVLVFDPADNSFGLNYQDCANLDIPCHLGNALIYFLTEMPVISDIFGIFLPIVELFTHFVNYVFVFEMFGWLFYIGVGALFIAFCFKFLR